MSTIAETSASRTPLFDAIIVGGGFSGLAMLRHVRELNMSVRVLEAGSDVGGTWYWNKYPGARTDSESWYYCFSFSDEALAEWDWTERYPAQPEMLRYFAYIAEKFDFRKDIEFNCEVKSARYLPEDNLWELETKLGQRLYCTYLLTAVGILSAPYLPEFKGLEEFEGDWYQTARWPDPGPNFRNKKVALVGTGATGVQAAPLIAERADHLFVFQRTANYVIPAQNHNLDNNALSAIKNNYNSIWQDVRAHSFGMPFKASGRLAAQATPEELDRVFWEGWRNGGFKFLFETFDDLLVNPAANKVAADFIRARIRETVKDPVTAETLCPTDHPYGGKRPPGGHGYYETFNRSNVTLVDVKTNVIEEITKTGIRTQDGTNYGVDAIVFATGFDGFTGAYVSMDIYGESGTTLREKWRGGARTFMGFAAADFPNLLMINGPLTPFANNPPTIELTAKWVADLLAHMRNQGFCKVEATTGGEQEWIEEVAQKASLTLVPLGAKANSWLSGANIPGKAQVLGTYMGGLVVYSEKCRAEAEAIYPHFLFSRPPSERFRRELTAVGEVK